MSDMVLVSGSAHPSLGAQLALELGARVARCVLERFPDGELHVEVDSSEIDGLRAVVVQPTFASDHVLELLLITDACRRAGAAHVVAVIPYFGYARQDRCKRRGEPLGLKVIANVLQTAALERVISVDVHSAVTEAVLDVAFDEVSAVPLLAEALSREVHFDSIVVAPDLGAVRRAREVAELLSLPFAIVHKVRRSGESVEALTVAGDVEGRAPLLIDDMVTTGGTIAAAAAALCSKGAQPQFVVAATHPVLASGSIERLRSAGLRKLLVTDTLPVADGDPVVQTLSLAPMLASVIRRALR